MTLSIRTALDRLSSDGMIDPDREEIVDNRLRRYYRLTPEGQSRLADETARLRANAAVAARRLRLAGNRWRPPNSSTSGTYAVIEATHAWVFPARMLAEPLLLVVAPMASLAALLASAGPRRGRQLMRRRNWV
jgi:hypothetical protein